MSDRSLIGHWIRRFLLEHVVEERNLARNTQASYRDTLALLIPFITDIVKKLPDQLVFEDLSSDNIRLFLLHLEEHRRCSVATRNQRLAAIHALSRFVSEQSPEHIAWAATIRLIPFKRRDIPSMPYLDKPEMDALLDIVDRTTVSGLRDYAILLFLYNTGARADEVARLTIADVYLDRSPSVRILGKRRKERFCPLWTLTAQNLRTLTAGRPNDAPVFLNCRGQALTRFGIHALVVRYVEKASQRTPSLSAKRVSPHTIRHTTAVHLLRAGVDINTIRAWLGHVSLDTTNIYAEIDLEMKAKALAHCEIFLSQPQSRDWKDKPELMEFPRSL
jgi:integrase/recombinase XerD